MAYYVIGDQGQRYGPADVTVLNVWISEGRLVANTILEDEASGSQIFASTLTGLQFDPYALQTASNYPRHPQPQAYQPLQYQLPPASTGEDEYKWSVRLAWVSPVLSLVFSIAGFATALGGILTALRAKEFGHPRAQKMVVYSAWAMGFWVLISVLRLGLFLFLLKI
jgi:hypothetical protein